ncbi:DUF2188 domain-containing protein [Pseudomonas sp. No.117]
MQNYHIEPSETGWELREEKGGRALLKASTKDAIVHQTAQYMEGKTGSVKIHTGDGRIEEERTYPRSADPAQSKG